MNEIRQICEKHKIALVEDAAHAHGAEYKQIRAGNLGLAGSFSFYPTKVLTTAEGGMITTNDEKLYKKAPPKRSKRGQKSIKNQSCS